MCVRERENERKRGRDEDQDKKLVRLQKNIKFWQKVENSNKRKSLGKK